MGSFHDIPAKFLGRISEDISCHLCAERSTLSKSEEFSENKETKNCGGWRFLHAPTFPM